MRTPFKNPFNSFAPIFLVLMAIFVFGFGCKTSKPTPDPLAGFHRADEADMDKNKAITDDYKTYIHTLSSDEQKNAGPILFYEDGTGQYAVKLQIGINGTEWMHILVYDNDNKRIKTIKYSIGHYAS
jgi:hypothetical protein